MPGPQVRATTAAQTYCRFLVVVAGITLSGCVRIPRPGMPDLWSSSGSWHWPVGMDKSTEGTERSNVSANVARSSSSDQRTVEPIATSQPRPVIDDSPAALDVSSDAPPTEPAESDPFAASSGTLKEPPQQRFRELKAALSADAAHGLADVPASATHPMRLRVDGLLRRARELLKGGELREARRMAQVAAELSDAISLEFLPTEERPNDVLREIDDQLEQFDAESVAVEGEELPPFDPSTHSAPQTSTSFPAAESGMVVANVPRSIRTWHNAPSDASPDPDSETLEVLPELTVVSPEPLPLSHDRSRFAQLARGDAWNAPGGESANHAEQPAPPPPLLDEIGPLPGFTDRTTAVPDSIGSAPVPAESLLFWTDWLAAMATAAILAVVGLGLAIRRWRSLTWQHDSPGDGAQHSDQPSAAG